MNLGEHLASRKLALDTVAAKASIARERLSAIVSGADATLAEMRAIAKALRLPLASLVAQEPAEPVKALFRRTLDQREAVSSELEVISAQVRDALAIARGLPKNTAWLELFRGMVPQPDAAEEFAQLFRKAYAGLDDKEPFPRLPQVANELGVFVLFSRDSLIEGVSAIVEGYAMVIVGARTFMPRALFTMAHEFGHLVAHHDNRASGYAHFDREGDVESLPTTQVKDEERFADAFASALLLPRHGVLLAVKAIRQQLGAQGPLGDIEILWLAHLFSVSFEVAARRCEGLGLIPPRGSRALYQKLTENHSNPERRAAEVGIPDRLEIVIETSPTLLRAAAKKVKSGEVSLGRAAELLNVSIATLFVANAEIAV
jgi:Zn-dependent peptidase ImmA (M78 family)